MIRRHWTLALLAGVAVLDTVKRPDFWTGFLVGTVACAIALRLVEWWSDRWLRKVQGHR